MSEPTTPLPESPFCRVRARVASIWADGPDAGTSPDWRPAVGEKVTLTPSISSQLLVYDAAGPEPIIVTVERVQCEVDADGWLVKSDGRPVYIAPTDDPLLSATGWTWTASIKGKSVPFSAPAGGVVDLALYVATPAVDATEYVSVVQIVADYITANPTVVEQATADYLTAHLDAAVQPAVDAAVAPHIAQVNLISGLTGEDDAVALLARDTGSETHAAVLDVAVPATVLKPTAAPPAGFRGLSKAPTMQIRRRMGRFTVDWDLESLRPPAGATYYVAPDGTSGNDGLTPSTPTTVGAAVQKPDVGTILYAPGEYFRNTHAVSVAVNYGSINHIAQGPGVYLTSFERTLIVWVHHDGHVYKVDRNEPFDIFDVEARTPWGDYTRYERVPAPEDITAAGQWAWVDGTLYVWALEDADLTSSTARQRLRVSIAAHKGATPRANSIQWVEGIEFHGGNVAYPSNAADLANAAAVLIDCKMKYGNAYGVGISGGSLVVLDRCEISSTGGDGINWHDTNLHGLEFAEIDCHVHHVGENASSAHEAITGLRVGGLYDHAATSVVADVNSAHTWNLGCHAGAQTPVSALRSVSWRAGGFSPVEGEGTARMWLDECTSDGSDRAFSIVDGAQIHVHAHGASNPTIGELPVTYVR